jgi:molybdopterin converting factor small subunit
VRVRVELLGLSRLVTGTREVSLEMADTATYRDLVYTLSEIYPGLVGNVIQSDRRNLQAPNIFNLNARQMVQSRQMDDRLSEDDRIILMSISAGG